MKRKAALALLFAFPVLLSGCILTSDWSPDDKKVVYVQKDRNNFWQLWVYRPDKDDAEQVTGDRTNSFAPKWSPDGRYIAYKTGAEIGGKFKLWLMDARNYSKSMLAEGNGEEENNLLPAQWSADGSGFYFVDWKNGEYLLNLFDTKTGKIQTVFSSRNKLRFRLSQEKIAVLADGIWVMNADGTDKALAFKAEAPDEISLIGWTRDRKGILYMVQTVGSSVEALNLETGKTRQVFELRDAAVYFPVLCPARDTILYFSELESESLYGLFEADMKGNISLKVSGVPGFFRDTGMMPSWSKDFSKVFYYTCLTAKSDVMYPWVLDVDSGREMFVGTREQLKMLGPKIASYSGEDIPGRKTMGGGRSLDALFNEAVSSGRKTVFMGTVVKRPSVPAEEGPETGQGAEYTLGMYADKAGLGIGLRPAPEEKFAGNQAVVHGILKYGLSGKTRGTAGAETVSCRYIEAEKVESRTFCETGRKELSKRDVALSFRFTNPLDKPIENISFYFYPVNFECSTSGKTMWGFDRIEPGETKQIDIKYRTESSLSSRLHRSIIFGFTGRRDVIVIADFN